MMNSSNDNHFNYNIPEEASKLFRDGILNNPLIKAHLPADHDKFAAPIKFQGTATPSIPVNWRFAESVSALKALEATFINALLSRKYGLEPQEVTIDTQLYIMSVLLWKIDPHGKEGASSATIRKGPPARTTIEKYFPNTDIGGMSSTMYRSQATNIYKAKDGRFFHVHGSLDPSPTIEALGLPEEENFSSIEEAIVPFQKAVGSYESATLQRILCDEAGQAGTICWTKEEYKVSEHGKANAHVGLYELFHKSNKTQKPGWWPASAQTSQARPLAGLKVVDLTRIIAAPAATRGLAELGASVMRVTAKHLPDMHLLHPDLNWGKWNASLDLRIETERQALKDLIREADVVVSGYRPGVMEKYGFGHQQIFDMCSDRERGIIVMRENCFGWNGPWSHYSGWQQISDANCGVSMEFGKAMGHDEAVTPVFPNSDFCTGLIGVVALLDALLQRAEHGGSYQADIALNYYSQWLVNSCGTYPTSVWNDVWLRNGKHVIRHYHNMTYTMFLFLDMLQNSAASVLFKPEHFEDRECEYLGTTIRTPKPVLQFPGGKVKPGFQVGTRGNGVDKAMWPRDLTVEVVT